MLRWSQLFLSLLLLSNTLIAAIKTHTHLRLPTPPPPLGPSVLPIEADRAEEGGGLSKPAENCPSKGRVYVREGRCSHQRIHTRTQRHLARADLHLPLSFSPLLAARLESKHTHAQKAAESLLWIWIFFLVHATPWAYSACFPELMPQVISHAWQEALPEEMKKIWSKKRFQVSLLWGGKLLLMIVLWSSIQTDVYGLTYWHVLPHPLADNEMQICSCATVVKGTC